MDKEKRKLLREEYDQRKPDMGIVCWQSGDQMWIGESTDAKKDHNSSLFQLKLGSWPNEEMQEAFNKDPESFQWRILKELDYEDKDEDHSEDLEILFMMCMEEYPQAKQMKIGKK